MKSKSVAATSENVTDVKTSPLPTQSWKTKIAQTSWTIKLIILLIVLGASYFAYTQFASTTTETPTYQTTQATKQTLITSITGSGQVSTANSAAITTTATGVIKKVLVTNGQTVKSGQAIAEIELDQTSKQKYSAAQASYQSAKNTLASAQASQYSLQAQMFSQWDEYKELSETDTYKDSNSDNRNLAEFNVSQKEWLAAEAQYKNQQAVIAQAQTNVSSAWLSLQQASPIIYAPIAGNVDGLSLQVGSVLTSSNDTDSGSQKIASIKTTALPTITINLTEIDVLQVNLDDKVTITLDALPNKTFTGKVASIDTVGSVSSGVTSYPAVIVLDTQSEDILSNMSVQASIITEVKDNVMVVPSNAIKTDNGASSVQVMHNGSPETVIVETGISSATQIEVISGLNEGDTVVTNTTTTTNTSTSTTKSPFSSVGGGGMMRMAR